MHKILKAANLDSFSGLYHGFTTNILNNDYDRIAEELGVLPSQVYALKQIHSADVVVFEKGMELYQVPPGDAYVTSRKDVIVGVKTADCVPILAYDDDKEVVAAIHAGYKGMLKGIIANSIHLMTDHFGCDVAHIHCAIGPCISVDHYEVSSEIIQMFEQHFGKLAQFKTFVKARPHLDLRGTAAAILESLGIHPEHIAHLNLCTFEKNDFFFSHRREPRKERQFNFIGMKS